MGKVLDLEAIRQASANLDRIAADHPELLGKSTPEEWEEILKEQVNQQIAERQRRLVAKRLTEGKKRALIWAPKPDLDALKDAYPGPRGGIDWQTIIQGALEKAGKGTTP